MGDEIKYLKTKNATYPFIYSLNVMSAIQNEYGSITEWSKLIESKDGKEPNIDALLFFFTEAINEGIDIENEQKNNNRDFINKRKVGRIISEIGIEESAKQLKEAVVSSVNNDENITDSKN